MTSLWQSRGCSPVATSGSIRIVVLRLFSGGGEAFLAPWLQLPRDCVLSRRMIGEQISAIYLLNGRSDVFC